MTRLMTALAMSLAGALTALPAQAQAGADLAAIDDAVARFTGAAQGTPGGAAHPVDRRLRLNPCTAPLALGWFGGRQDTVEVACPVAGGWKLYVPLAATAAHGGAPAVLRGEGVTIAVRDAGFAVSQPGEALESGALGAWIKVRGLGQNAPIIRARVVRPGLVGIDLGTDLP